MTVVVIKTFLGNTYLLSGILQIHFFLGVIRFHSCHMKVTPMFYQCNYLCNGPLFASVFYVSDVGIFGVEKHTALIFWKCYFPTVFNKNKSGIQVVVRHLPISTSNFMNRLKLVALWIIDEEGVVIGRYVFLEEASEVNMRVFGLYFDLNQFWLLCFLFLKDESFECFRVSLYFNHNFIFFCWLHSSFPPSTIKPIFFK